MRRLVPAVALVLLAGCPGELEDPDRFPEQPLALCQLEGFDVPALFRSKCGSSACHEGDEPAAELDLVSPGVFARLDDVPATQCDGRVRVDPREPSQSFLVEKLRGTQPVGCGERMPFVSFLTGAEIACVERWVFEQTVGLDGGVARPDAGSPDAGPARDGGDEADLGSAGDDMGPGDVDCTPFEGPATTQLCLARADGCEVLSLMMTSCDDTCALAGLRCTAAVDNLVGMCAPDPAVLLTCDDASRADLHCVCER